MKLYRISAICDLNRLEFTPEPALTAIQPTLAKSSVGSYRSRLYNNQQTASCEAVGSKISLQSGARLLLLNLAQRVKGCTEEVLSYMFV